MTKKEKTKLINKKFVSENVHLTDAKVQRNADFRFKFPEKQIS